MKARLKSCLTEMLVEDATIEQRVLVLAPSGRDGVLAAQALERFGIATSICRATDDLVCGIGEGAGAAVVAEEALTRETVSRLAAALEGQPPWSDFPLIIFTAQAATANQNRRALETFASLGSVTILERPIHPLTMVSGVRAALRSRARQYNARAVLTERERDVRQRDQFLAMLGHELRNPLGALRNAAEVTRRKAGETPGLERPIAIIDRQIKHLTQLVDDLLDVARVTSGKIVIKPALVDLAALIRALGDEMLRTARERHLEIYLDLPSEPVLVMGDSVRLEQIVQNLLANALKYTPSGGEIEVTVTADDPVVVVVADTGVGIGDDILDTVFEPFTQAARTLDRAQGGMGLGLSVARALARLHGGDITVSSAGLGSGSTFSVTLPRAPADAIRPLVPAGDLRMVHLSRTILLIEDGADNRESLEALLELFGHRVDCACDGDEGIERALALRPEVALVDIGLPRVDGYEVARRLRSALGSQIYLVAVTGYGQPEDRARALATGFDAHVSKPIDPDAIARLLAQIPPAASARSPAQDAVG